MLVGEAEPTLDLQRSDGGKAPQQQHDDRAPIGKELGAPTPRPPRSIVASSPPAAVIIPPSPIVEITTVVTTAAAAAVSIVVAAAASSAVVAIVMLGIGAAARTPVSTRHPAKIRNS